MPEPTQRSAARKRTDLAQPPEPAALNPTRASNSDLAPDPLAPAPKPDIALIAAEASVSIATVSRVLNGRTGVSDAKRGRVEAAMQHHGYVRRVRATDSAPLIELVLPNLQNAWAVELVRGVQRVAHPRGMSVVLTNSGDILGPNEGWIEGVIQRGVSAVVLVFADVSADDKARLAARNVPFAIVNSASPPAPDVISVQSAAFEGAVLATEHLLQLGHRRIGLITGPDALLTSRERVAGFRAAFARAGLPVAEQLIRPGLFRREDGEREGRSLLALSDRPTAIFAGSDPQAFGVYQAARERGMRIPADLSVVGFDDLPVSALAGPPLTTVRQPLEEMAAAAAQAALDSLLTTTDAAAAGAAAAHVELQTTLIVRASTASPASLG